MTDAVLIITFLVFAHLLADFVLQNDWIALNKGTGGRTGWAALGMHGFHVGLCLSPAILVWGAPAILYIAIVVGTHMAVDRWKVNATRRSEAAALEAARRRLAGTGEAPMSGLGRAWTPWPGMLFLADQALHLTIALVAWLVILEGVAFTQWFLDVVNTILRTWDRAVVHAVVLGTLVLTSLFIVNTRAAYYFVLALVSPRELPPATPATVATGAPAGAPPAPASVPEPPAAPAAAAAVAPGYTVRVGPIVATVEPGVATAASATAVATATADDDAETLDSPAAPNGTAAAVRPTADPAPVQVPVPATAAATAPDPARPAPSVPSGAPARIGATIGALERLLIVTLVLIGAEAAIGLVIAAKTLARFKQLDDRGFAEYYLLGTLASVSVALATGLLGAAALATIP